MKEILRIKYVIVLIIAVCLIFLNIDLNNLQKSKDVTSLVIYGDNISTDYVPFVENDSVYISVDTISKVIDQNIYYDKITSKVIITTYSDVLKLKIDDKKLFKNTKYADIKNAAKLVDDMAYIPIDEVKDIYNIDISYNQKTNTISIDKKNVDSGTTKYNKLNIYSNIDTRSNVIEKVNKNTALTVYTEGLEHNRWYKVKTENGAVGYISKKCIEVTKNNEKDSTTKNSDGKAQKIDMFWQYGSSLSTLGLEKIQGVNVVSPTWFELSSSKGDISSKFDQNYYNQAKTLGYKIWPIITNGIDSANYSASTVSSLLNSEYNRQQLINNIINLLNKYNLDGINIDFEQMKTEDKDMFTQFIRELAPIMRKNSKTLSVDMYFVAYIDRARVGEASDYIALMGYDQRGNWSSKAGSISEISWVDSNISSLINDSKVDPSKIILGIPFYTRLWIEDSTDQSLTTNIYSMKTCQTFIAEHNLTPILDQDAGQNYVQYTSGNVTYKLWIEDNDSIKKRIEIVNKYNLAGVSGWKKGLELSSTWQVINDNLNKQ